MFILYIALALVAALVGVILVRTLTFSPKAGAEVSDETISFDGNTMIVNLRQLIRCKTVSYADKTKEDDAEFKKLRDLLPTLYPTVFRKCEVNDLPDRALLIKWEGKKTGDPAVFMAHYDVVPVDEKSWDKPPFEAILENGVVWGRGSLDTKITMNGILFAAEHLMRRGFTPEHDIYFAFSGNEETNGAGAKNIVDLFEKNGITPSIVLDEGGAVVENVFPGVKAPCAVVGIAEKGLMNIEYKVKSAGGHASAPAPHTPVGVLSRACCRIECKPFKRHLTKPAAEMFDTLGRHSNFLYKMIFANLWCFSGLLDLICKASGGEINALMRTTVAFTQMTGSSAPNVIPPEARMVSNIRLNPEDTVDSAKEYIEKVIGDKNVEVTVLNGDNPSRVSRTDCPEWNKLGLAIASTWKGSIVTPYLMVQCSDSRHWGRISDKVYRFSAMDLTKEERATIHGNNERIRIDCAKRTAEFYIRMLKQF